MMQNICRDCKGEVIEDKNENIMFCRKCGLVMAELIITHPEYDGRGKPQREFVKPFYFNFHHTRRLTPWEFKRVLRSRHDHIGGALTRRGKRKGL